jgi:hypothetical protein
MAKLWKRKKRVRVCIILKIKAVQGTFGSTILFGF